MAVFVIGSIQFPTKQAATKTCQAILHKYLPGETVDSVDTLFLRDLFALHPRYDQKIKCGISSFQVDFNPPYTTIGFWLTRPDGSRSDWSFKDCLKPPSHKARVYAACRELIAPQILTFRRKSFQDEVVCPVTGEILTNTPESHIHHTPPFEILVQNFLLSQDISLEDAAIRPSQDGEARELFIDNLLAQSWINYHQIHAKLTIVSQTGHLRTLHGSINS